MIVDCEETVEGVLEALRLSLVIMLESQLASSEGPAA